MLIILVGLAENYCANDGEILLLMPLLQDKDRDEHIALMGKYGTISLK